MAKRDFYDILEISRSASPEEIRRAHRKLVRKYHPDVNKDNKAAEDKFKEVQEAYDVLSDSEKRKNYDQFGHAGVGANAPHGAGVDPFEAFRRAQQSNRSRRRSGGPTVENVDFGGGGAGGNGDFGDIFEQIFGGRAGGRQQAEPTPPADVEYPINITFEQAARGTNLPLQINRDGRLETIEVKIPPGVKQGSRIRLRGQGQRDTRGRASDLFIVTNVAAHPYFRREDLDIHLDVPLSVYEAMLGTKLDVPTLDGTVALTIPPGTNSGAKLRIKGRGFARGEAKGDQICVVRITVPKHLDDEDRKLVEQLRAKHPLVPRSELPW